MRRIVRILAALSLALVLCGGTAMADFDYEDFASIPNLDLVGDATVVGSRLELTPALTGRTGAAWYKAPQEVVRGFTTTFRFRIVADGPGADGLAFVIHNDPAQTAAIGGLGGGIGYLGLNNVVAVEFDTWDNGWAYEPLADANHVSVHYLKTYLQYSVGYTSGNIPDLSDGAVHTVRIEYVPRPGPMLPGLLTVHLDDMERPVVVAPLILEDRMTLAGGESAWVGFTAATGAEYQTHEILSWSFESAATYRFDQFALRRLDVEFERNPDIADRFAASGGFRVAPSSDGIDLLAEDVRFQIGPSKTTIPAGSFSKSGQRYEFSGMIDGKVVDASFVDLGLGVYGVRFSVAEIDLSGCANPETWMLKIGNDAGALIERLDGELAVVKPMALP